MNEKERFLSYVSGYDRSDGKVNLKIIHTMEVAQVIDALTDSLNLSDEMKELAHICAIYHDIGRFEQLRRFDTFDDGISVDHAQLSCEIIKQQQLLKELSQRQQKMVLTAIENHNRFAIENGLDEDTMLLCKLIRDADKCDIFRVFAYEDMSDTMGETLEQVSEEEITDAVMDSIMKHQCVDKALRRTGLDKWIGYLGFFYDLYFVESFRFLMREKNYRKPFDAVEFKNPETAVRVRVILEDLEAYIRWKMTPASSGGE